MVRPVQECADQRSIPAIRAVGVSVRFGGVHALDDVTISVEPGEVCGLIGPNGAGKTTLFDVLSGVRSPTAGHVYLGEEEITGRSATWRARRGIARTFQRQQLFAGLSVHDNVLAALEWRGGGGGVLGDLTRWPQRVALARQRAGVARRALVECGLDDIGDTSANTVSIGAARLLELARATADEPRVLLLDEPTSGLDPVERDRLGDLVRRQRDCGTAILLVEHDVDFVMSYSDRVAVLSLGVVVAHDTPTRVRDDQRVIAAYLS